MRYRFGFNGHENDNEVKGTGNHLSFGDYGYDTRLGRRWNIDPKTKKFPDVSPYSFASNSPILFVDKDGKEVVASSIEAQTLVLKTLNYAFGGGNGFSFVNNKLIHNGEVPKNLTPQQTLLFKYFNETLVKSTTVTYVLTNTNSSTGVDANGNMLAGIVPDGEATTFNYSASRKYSKANRGYMPYIINSVDEKNDIVITNGLIKNGIDLDTETGSSNFGVDHALLHEFAHAMMYTIMSEFKGEFNGIDFNQMTREQRSDWAIQYTNTLLQAFKKALETGKGQHDREPNEAPTDSTVEPINK